MIYQCNIPSTSLVVHTLIQNSCIEIILFNQFNLSICLLMDEILDYTLDD